MFHVMAYTRNAEVYMMERSYVLLFCAVLSYGEVNQVGKEDCSSSASTRTFSRL